MSTVCVDFRSVVPDDRLGQALPSGLCVRTPRAACLSFSFVLFVSCVCHELAAFLCWPHPRLRQSRCCCACRMRHAGLSTATLPTSLSMDLPPCSCIRRMGASTQTGQLRFASAPSLGAFDSAALRFGPPLTTSHPQGGCLIGCVQAASVTKRGQPGEVDGRACAQPLQVLREMRAVVAIGFPPGRLAGCVPTCIIVRCGGVGEERTTPISPGCAGGVPENTKACRPECRLPEI